MSSRADQVAVSQSLRLSAHERVCEDERYRQYDLSMTEQSRGSRLFIADHSTERGISLIKISWVTRSRTDRLTDRDKLAKKREPIKIKNKYKIKQQKQNHYCQLYKYIDASVVFCSITWCIGHIRQLYPWDNWPDRDAKQVRRHFEERARSQVRDTTNELASSDSSD